MAAFASLDTLQDPGRQSLMIFVTMEVGRFKSSGRSAISFLSTLKTKTTRSLVYSGNVLLDTLKSPFLLNRIFVFEIHSTSTTAKSAKFYLYDPSVRRILC